MQRLVNLFSLYRGNLLLGRPSSTGDALRYRNMLNERPEWCQGAARLPKSVTI